jgi:hypothetical protein
MGSAVGEVEVMMMVVVAESAGAKGHEGRIIGRWMTNRGFSVLTACPRLAVVCARKVCNAGQVKVTLLGGRRRSGCSSLSLWRVMLSSRLGHQHATTAVGMP